MEDIDYESSWQAASGNVEIIKKVLFLISIIIFLFIAAITLSILQKANVNIESCEIIAEKSAYYDHGTRIRTQIAAEKILWELVGPVDFTGDSLEVCGVAFIFKGNNDTGYMFCENGMLYRTIKECNSLL
ncbi:MAG: hypothetical protein KAJ91_04600 [Candidatus Aenigmarchaeota archaeon]|nr:hypothetical protein [Candidatus Aenigmarchaeota archaeon]